METGKVACLAVKVQKCQYCAQEGDSLMSIAASFNSDWLHLYTANPTLRDPDHISAGTVVNTGVLYEVREGDYLALLADKFFTSADAILAVNPELPGGAPLLEGSEVCILLPVCGIECEHGLDCRNAFSRVYLPDLEDNKRRKPIPLANIRRIQRDCRVEDD